MATQIKSIPLSGLSTNPSDLMAEDGTLAAAINVHHDLDAISPVHATAPQRIKDFGSDTVVYQHKNADYCHLIIRNGNDYFWADYNNGVVGDKVPISELANEDVKNVVGIGNTLVFYTENDVYYYLKEDNIYKFLGNKIPEIHISFGLQHDRSIKSTKDVAIHGRVVKFNLDARGLSDEAIVNSGEIYSWKLDVGRSGKVDDKTYRLDGDKNLTTLVMGNVNKYSNIIGAERGRFLHPFFVRYAYRLYDGSTTMASIPVLMVTTSKPNPELIVDYERIFKTELGYHLEFSSFSLDYLANAYDVSKLSAWRDIVKSVDIFITDPIYLYDPDGEIKTMYDYPEKGSVNSMSISKQYETNTYRTFDSSFERFGACNTAFNDGVGQDEDMEERYYRKVDGEDVFCYPSYGINLPEKTKSEIKKDINSKSVFYLLSQLPIDNIETETRKIIDIDKNALRPDVLVTSESLVEDYRSHDTVIAGGTSVYNNRLSTFGTKIKLFGGLDKDGNNTSFYIDDIVPYQTPDEGVRRSLHVRIKEAGKTVVVSTVMSRMPLDASFPFLYYPNPNADRMDIRTYTGDTYTVKKINLRPHDGLDGAFASCSFPSVSVEEDPNNISEEDGLLERTNDDTVIYSNEVRTSEVNNPFVFKAANVEQVGNGKIIALVPQAVALSQGQFGQYPMTCFTTDGIWALTPNETGGWAAKQPFSRDVVLKEDSGNILQLDRDIMFATNRGLMLLSGSNVECISDIFDGNKDEFKVYSKPVGGTSASLRDGYMYALERVFEKKVNDFDVKDVRPDAIYKNADTANQELDPSIMHQSFKEFIGNAVFLYDYTHQRIIVGNEDYPFSFVYNMNDKVWTSMLQRITSAVNSYPQCLAMTKDASGHNLLVDFSRSTGVDTTAVITDADAARTAAYDVDLPTEGFIITRPIKLGDATTQKTLRTINVQGKFARGHVSIILFGCSDNNMSNWFLVGSCKGSRMPFRYGSPFKYFRVALLSQLEPNESISSITIEYEVKENNKLRQ